MTPSRQPRSVSHENDMKQTKQIWILVGLFALFLLLLTIGIHAALWNNALGFDYMFYWEAGRAIFVEGISPYSPEVIQRIQMAIYGRPALPGEYPYPFPYPLPILIVPFPLYFLRYDWSQAAWMAFNLLAPVAVGILCFPRAPKWLVLTLPLFYQVAFTWIIGNYALLIGMIFIVVFAALLAQKRPPGWVDAACGAALAWVIYKPQMTWLFVGLALLMALKGHRWGLIAGFFAGLAAGLLLSFLLLPGWPAQWLNVARIYPQESEHVPALLTYLGYLLPAPLARTASLVLACALALATAWLFWRWRQGRLNSLLLLAWCGLVTSLVDLSALTPDQIVLLVPVFLWAVAQRPSIRLALGWFLAIAITYVFFFLTQFGILADIVDRGPLLVYLAWLVFLWLGSTARQRKATSLPSPAA